MHEQFITYYDIINEESSHEWKQMRNHIILTGLYLMLPAMIGIAFVTASQDNIVKAHVWIQPQRLTIDGHECPHLDEWITAFIQLPKKYRVRDIEPASITLQVNGGEVPASNHYAAHGGIIVAKFDRTEVTCLLNTMVGHMMPQPMQRVTLVITGNLCDGSVFRGEDTINVFFGSN